MTKPTFTAVPALIGAGMISFYSLNLPAQSFPPSDVGSIVNGFQDDFSSATRNPDWVSVPAESDRFWVQANGVLSISTMSPNPNHLLYKPATPYDDSAQEVLARIRVKKLNPNNDALVGPAAGCNPDDPGGHPGAGIDFMLTGQGPSVILLNDYIEWGPVVPGFTPALNTWYWLRLRQDGADTAAGPNIRAKVWLADGTVPEPSDWQQTWAQANRVGLAGIKGPSWDSATEAEVDYILIKAAGLPSIMVTPSGFVQIPVTITNQPQSQAVMELSPATFEVAAQGYPAPTCQWYQNGTLIAGATNTTYTIAKSLLSDDQALFQAVLANVVSNVTHSVTSRVATLTVTADTIPPVLLGAQSLGLSQVQVFFSERIAATTAANPAHYALSDPNGSLTILSAALDVTETSVVLNVSPMTENAACTLTVNGLSDQSAAANVIAAGAQVVFTPLDYQPRDIGNPAQAGSVSATNNGYAVTAGGQDIGGTADQFHFSYRPQSGDFDVRVRLESLGFSDAWAKAGLMARETTNANSRFASVLATPSIGGAFFLSRASLGVEAAPAGSFPVNYPYTWLRLARAGNLFAGYASLDGERWEELGAVTLALSNTVYLGMAVASHRADQTVTAQFRDLAPVTGETLSAAELPFEPLAACSRRTALVISEIMYHPAPRADGKNLEFVELFNSHAFDADLSGHRLAGDIEFAFPAGTILPAGAFLVVAKSRSDVQSVYGISGVLGPFAHDLPNPAGTVRLCNEQGSVLLEVNYSSQAPWPRAADGAGHSLVLARASYGEGDPRAWGISDVVGGSPGRMDSFHTSPLRSVLINEVLANAGAWPAEDFVELYNHSQQSNDISGCILTDDPANTGFVVPTGTVRPPYGFVYFTQAQLGFGLKAGGETIYLKNPDASRVLDAVGFEAQAEGVSLGRWPDGANEFYPLAAPTAGAADANPRVSEIVINELMYRPISNDDDDQFIELYNRGTNAVELSGWKFVAGVNFTFPRGTVIASNGFLVVAKNMTNLLAKYANLNAGNTVGDFGGALSHGGERVALAMPQFNVTINNQGELITNTLAVVVDEVTYTGSGRWSHWSDGGGSSLELIDPRANHRLASNWADSDESAKAPWTTVEYTGVLDLGSPTYAASGIQVLLLGAGECLVDNVEVILSGNNLVANGTFESGTNGWQLEGNHETSTLETTEGFNSARSLHLRANGAGDSYANRLRTSLTMTIPSGSTATLRAKVRWLCGYPEILLRLRGNWLEADGRLIVPPNLGTPGARNSRAVANGAPAIYEVVHSPVLPAANQAVVVRARVEDPDGLSAVRLKYRVDPAATYSMVTMVDDGTGGDATAGDGIFSASIPVQPANALVAFYVEAADNNSVPATARFPGDAPARECLVRFGEIQPFSGFGTYRLWLTQATFNHWCNRRKTSDQPLDCTFVNGTQRVIYNAGVYYAGSVWKSAFGLIDTPTGNACHYKLEFPPDDGMLGVTAIEVGFPGNVGSGIDQTAQVESTSFGIVRQLGLKYLDRRYFNLFINGVRRGYIIFDAQWPDRDMAKELFPDDAKGELFKAEFWFEADSDDTQGSNYYDTFATMTDFKTTGGVKKTARYRWNFQQRAVGASNNGYTNWFGLVDALNSPVAGYTAAVESVADAEQWMRVFAYEHMVNNWEAFGYTHGVNMYFYRDQHTRWTLIPKDVDISFRDQIGNLLSTDDAVLQRMINHPPFRRAYWRAFEDAVNGPLLSTRVNPLVDARYAALQANGVQVVPPDNDPQYHIKSYIANARNYILAKLATVAAQFAVNGPATLSTNSNPITLSGTAPVTIKTITINGVAWPVTWTSVTNWTLRLPINAGTNLLDVIGYDLRGQFVAGASNHLSVVYTGPNAAPQDAVVINEIMSAPLVPGAEFVELYNSSTNATFDLSGWRLDGIAFTFPEASYILPLGYVVLAKDRWAYFQAYGASAPLFAEFNGNLPAEGETLTLIKPGVAPADDLIIDQVRYGNAPPWPSAANGTGSSLQLIDAGQDNWRVANWAASFPPLSLSPGSANPMRASLPPFPPLFLNELEADNLTGITNSEGQRAAWIELYNPSTNILSLDGLYLADSYTNLTAWEFPTDALIRPGEFRVVFADGQAGLSTATELHASFALSSGSGSVALSWIYHGQPRVLDYIDYANIGLDHSYGSFPDGQSFDRQELVTATPGSSYAGSGVASPQFIPYSSAGAVYEQDFNALPNPGTLSVNASNPVTIKGVTYSLSNPFGFAFPASDTGKQGGLGIPALAGWYGLVEPSRSAQIGASYGDQTTGGQISFGFPNNPDRALGLLATASTGFTAFGAKFINGTGTTLRYINLQFTGELWRQSNLPKTLECYYFIDPTAANFFATNRTASVPSLNVSFPTVASAVGGIAVDGTASSNQTQLAVLNQMITDWPSGAALWLVWEMADSTGKAQGLAIDHLRFSASNQPLSAPPPSLAAKVAGDNLILSWPSILGQTCQLESTDDLAAGQWTPLGDAFPGTGAPVVRTNSLNGFTRRFFRLRILP